jgi:hypothetical protein
MAERKNFLLLAIGMGAVGIIIGAITIWNMIADLLKP